jgi:hypothetical protein
VLAVVALMGVLGAALSATPAVQKLRGTAKERPAVKPKQAGQATQPAGAEDPASSVAA